MQTLYLLLRNNKESGPFTIGELLQQQLKSSDLIWVQGKSQAWLQVSELELLPSDHFIHPEPKQAVTETSGIYVSRPGQKGTAAQDDPAERSPITVTPKELERRADEIRRRALAFTPPPSWQKPVNNGYYGRGNDYNPLEDEPVQVEIHRRKMSLSAAQTVFVILGTALLALAVWKRGMLPLYNKRIPVDQTVSPVVTTTTTTDQHAAHGASQPPATAAPQQVDSLVLKANSAAAIDSSTLKATAAKPKSKPRIEKKIDIPAANSNQQTTAASTEATPPPKEEATSTHDQPTAEKKETPEKKDSNTTAQPTEKKKRGFLGGLFRKKKKDGEE